MKKYIKNFILIISFVLILSCNNQSNNTQESNTSNTNIQNNKVYVTNNYEGRIPSKGFAAFSANGVFEPYEFTRHAVGSNDILIDILYSGICHSDIHSAKSDWGTPNYPIVPGHEIVGIVTQVGENVTKFKVGDYAGVGCMVNSCGECENCLNNQEQYCLTSFVGTYDNPDRFHDNEITRGGYSDNIVVYDKFAVKIPDNADIKKVAPLLCAGVTTYSPIKVMNVSKGDKIGIAGFGGLGHLAVKYAVNLGAEVTVFDITEEKREDALKMGAVKYVNVNNANELTNLNNTLDYIISTIPANYDISMYMNMLKRGGEMAILGIPAIENMPSVNVGTLVLGNGSRKLFGSLIGGMKETQEALDYSIANNIYPDVEIINADAQAITEAYNKVINGEVKFRYVIDMKTIDNQ
ncbi:NAD(P)-dependent alcohol dehydrogenase [Brachyspira alvinipulli]|uniref:NAD(P)-dependent alcohol dehydrogenase n=1 Tax=Brachyspira alvinipulli TaxID=84379 RepID=UPI000489D382|nr:NAD(P)-dependent alcohol dehydrogenase [Brachyspira alvinipulli]